MPPPEQILATCFHRNHMTNGEGGRDPAESRVDYVLDRTNTTGTLFLGLTLGCTQCHDHKFDPVSQADYYSLSAYFDSIDEDGKRAGARSPTSPTNRPTPSARSRSRTYSSKSRTIRSPPYGNRALLRSKHGSQYSSTP